MDVKTCSKCGETKPISEFNKKKSGRFGVGGICKICKREIDAEYRATHKEEVLAYNRQYLANHPDRNKAYYSENRQYFIDKAAAWKRDNPERSRENERRFLDQNPNYHAEWRANNREKVREIQRRSYAKRMKNAGARLQNSVHVAVSKALSGGRKQAKTFDLLGYSLSELKAHLEPQFLPGMSWENYGKFGWHLDHRMPRSSFQFETADDPGFRECWALSNLQPLWWQDNLRKSDKVPEPANDNKPESDIRAA